MDFLEREILLSYSRFLGPGGRPSCSSRSSPRPMHPALADFLASLLGEGKATEKSPTNATTVENFPDGFIGYALERGEWADWVSRLRPILKKKDENWDGNGPIRISPSGFEAVTHHCIQIRYFSSTHLRLICER